MEPDPISTNEPESQPQDPPAMRLWTPEDYPLLKTWWEGHGWRAVPQNVLPPLGVIYRGMAAGWAYMDNGGTGVAMLEWLVTDPKSGLKGARALTHVIGFLLTELRRMNYSAVLTTCGNEALARLLERQGFTRTDSGMIHLVQHL